MAAEAWERVTLADIVSGSDGLQTGPFGAQLHASDYTVTGTPVVMPKDLDDGRIITESIARIPEALAIDLARHRVLSGDVLFGRRGDIGRCGLVTEVEHGWLCGTGCLRARPDPSRVAAAFLVQLIHWQPTVSWLMDNAVGQTMLNLNTSTLGRLPLWLPPLPEQRRIADILSSVDDTIEATEAVIEQLHVVKNAMMADLLTRGLPGHHTRFKPSELGEVPEAWDMWPLERWLVRIIDYRGKSPPKSDEGTPLITAKNVRSGYINAEPREYIAADRYSAWMTRGTPEPGDVLFTTEAPLGNAAPFPAGRFALGQRLVTLCPDRRRVDPDFLLWSVLSPSFQALLRSKATGSTVQGIKQSVLRTLNLAMPPLQEQAAIGAMIRSVAERSVIEGQVLEGLRSLKRALMSVLFTGEIRVTPTGR